LVAWALQRSIGRRAAEIGGVWYYASLALFWAPIVLAVLEFQPVVLRAMFAHAKNAGNDLANFAAALKYLGTVLAPLSAVVGFLSRPLAAVLKPKAEQPGWTSFVSKAVATAAVYLAGIAIPFLLWLAYIYLSYWGICRDDASPCRILAPIWLQDLAYCLFGDPERLVRLYFAVAVVLIVLSLMLTANANSLHRIYRDRLSKAFLFDPAQRQRALFARVPQAGGVQHTDRDLAPLDHFRLQDIRGDCAPYHLINTALNIQGSKWANRRGRNADFFFFSPKYIGGEATGYVLTETMENKIRKLDLATAMAISGAAASANMGANTIKPLTITLAILNIRVGFWLPSPGAVTGSVARLTVKRIIDNFYFLKELLGSLRETDDLVYLTDGGHVENLGVYELLRRRCRLIISVDAEADPAMSFASLVRLERMARIDLGIRIELPWGPIREATRTAAAAIAASGGQLVSGQATGPHCAIGTMVYPTGDVGILFYVKSSITGDEPDYIIDYKRRFSAFPQETTLDQLFGEEQFEAYRALGFHAMHRALEGEDDICVGTSKERLSRTAIMQLTRDAYDILF
jgi:hypothetical protein